MSISSATNRNDYTGNGATSAYSYTFRITDEDHLLVTVADTDGAETTLTITTDYTVSGVGSSSGGTVTLVNAGQAWLTSGNLTNNYSLSIRRKVPLTQTTDIRNQGDFFPETHEDQFDYGTFIDQQQQDEIDRSVKNPETLSSSSFDPTLPEGINTANVSLIVNPSGNGFSVGPTSNEISNAQTYANNASTSATNAATSETNAATSATNAASSATAAQNAAASVIWNDVVFLDNTDSPYTVTNSQRGKLLSVDCSSGAVTINLPGISGLDLTSPFVLGIKKTDSSANSITVNRDGTDTIDGNTSKSIDVADSGATFIPDTDPTPDEWTTADFGSSSGNLTVDSFSGDGSTTGFTLSVEPATENNTQVYISGVYQDKDTYSVSGTTLTFTTAPPTGTNNVEVVIGTTLSIGTPADGSVTRAKLAAGAVAPVNSAVDTTTETVTTSDDILLADSSGGAFTYTMPTEASASGRIFTFKKTSTDFNAVTINDDAASEITTINTEGETVKIFTDGTSWYVIDRYIPSEWTSYTPTGTGGWSTNTTWAGQYRRVKENIEVSGKVDLSGATDANSFFVDIPNSLTIDTAKIEDVQNENAVVGLLSLHEDGAGDFPGRLRYFTSSKLSGAVYNTNSVANLTTFTGLTNSNPRTLGSGDTVYFNFSVPISGWKG